MVNLIKAEIFKLKKNKAFKVLAILIIAYALILSLLYTSLLGDWLLSDADASFFGIFVKCLGNVNVILYLVVSIFAGLFICNDFENKIVQNTISSGVSRLQFLFTKSVVYSISICLFMLIIPFITGILASTKYGFGTITMAGLLKLILITLAMIMVYTSLVLTCVLIAFSFKTVGATISISMVWFLIGLNICDTFLPRIKVIGKIFNYLPTNLYSSILSLDASFSSIQILLLSTVLVSLITFFITYILFKKSELK